MDEALGLSGKARLAYEAAKKIAVGERMVQEGKLELANLFPGDGKLVANRMLADPSAGLFRKNNKTDSELLEGIMKLLKDGERVTAHSLRKRFFISDSHVKRLGKKLKNKISTKKDPNGTGRVWLLAKPKAKAKTKTKSTPKKKDSDLDPKRVDEVYKLLKSSEWITLHKIMTSLRIEWYLVKRIVEHLVDRGMVRSIKKVGNPDHKDKAARSREYTYWVAV